jgi:hypothetical protein
MLFEEWQDLCHLDYKAPEVGASSGEMNCKHLSFVTNLGEGGLLKGCEQVGVRDHWA